MSDPKQETAKQDSAPVVAPKPRRLRRVLRWVGASVGLLLILTLVGVAGAIAYLRTDAGLEQLRALIERVASTPEAELRIGHIGGSFPETLRIENVSLSDSQGPLISLDFAELRWNPGQLLARRLDISLFDVGTLAVNRLPASEPTPETPSDEPAGLPSLPVDIAVDRFQLKQLDLSAEVAGQPARLTAAAVLSASRTGEFLANASLQTLSDPPTHLVLDAGYAAATDQLKMHLNVDEAKGGLIGGLIGLPGSPPLRLQANGEAPLHDWQGRIIADATDVANIDIGVRLSGSEPLQIAVDGRADVAGLLPPDQAALVRGGVDLQADTGIAAERITFNTIQLATAAGRISAQGAFEPETNRIDATAQVVLGAPAVIAAVVPGLNYESVTADIHASGTLPVPDAEVVLTAQKLASGDVKAGAVELRAQAKAAGGDAANGAMPPIDLKADLVARALVPPSPELAPLLTDPVTVSLDGRYDIDRSHALIRSLQANAGPIALAAKADLVLGAQPSGTAEVRANEFALAPLSKLVGAPIDGRGRLDAQLSAKEDGRFELTLQSGASRFTSSASELATLLGPDPTVQAKASGNLNSAIDVDATIRTTQVHADAKGRVGADLSVIETARLRVDADDLRGLRPIVGAPIAGRFSIDAEARGPIDRLTGTVRATGNDIVFDEQRISRLKLDIDANAAAAGTRGTLALDAATSLGDLTARSDFGVNGAGDLLQVDRFNLTYAGALTTTATLSVPLNGRPIRGTVAVRSSDLAPVGRALDQDLAGRLAADIALGQSGGAQQATVDLRLDDFAQGPPQARAVEVGSVRASAQVVDPANKLRVQANVDAAHLRAADGEFTTATVRATGADNRYAIEVRADGDLQGVTRVALDADVRTGDTTVVTAQRLDARIHGEPLSLMQPARIEVGPDRLAVDQLSLTFARASATLALLKTSNRVRGQFSLHDFDLALLDKVQPGTGVRGIVGADLTVEGTPAAPTLTAAARAEHLRLSDVQPATRSRTPTLSAAVSATIRGGRMDANLNVDGLDKQPLNASVSAPVHLSIEPFTFAVDEAGPLQGAVNWHGEVAPVMQMLPIDELLLSGNAGVDLAIAGSLQHPLLNGEISLGQGRLEVFETGTILKPLDLAITARGEELELTRLEARDGGKGTLSGSGSVVLGESPRVGARIGMSDFAVIRREDVTSRLNGDISAQGTVGKQMLVAGRIENAGTEVRLINRLPPSVVTVNVKFTDKQAKPEAPAADQPAAPGLDWLNLDVTIALPGRVFVRGRGLTSEWAGQFTVTGTAAQPQVRGSLKPVRGDFDVLGKRFVLSDGKITIDGLDQDVMIDLTATYTHKDLTARVIVSGTAKDPKITLESSPELPQDEILARVLFDSSTGSLTALQAAQLAAAAASLASGEPGVLDKLRTATGLDRLTIGSGPDDGSGVGTLEAGKNIGDSVYVGVEQGLSATSGSAVVEVDITNNIKLRSSTSTEGSNRVGVRWEWDY
jgi:Uncharacterized protein conserved in bacteria